jgi:hypothetical protein
MVLITVFRPVPHETSLRCPLRQPAPIGWPTVYAGKPKPTKTKDEETKSIKSADSACLTYQPSTTNAQL